MLIDWFTVIAQLLNFLILVWLLKRFLYRPILNAIDERERKIAAQITEAAQRNEEAESQRALYLEKNDIFERERAMLLQGVIEEVKAEKSQLLESVHLEYEQQRHRKLTALQEEARELKQEIIQKTKDEAFEISRRILLDMASVSLEEQMTAVFIRQVGAMPDEERNTMVQSFRASRMPVILRSAFELPAAQREMVQNQIDQLFGSATSIQYETTPELISGIELISNGYKVAWSLDDTLSAAGKYTDRILRERCRPLSGEGEDCNGHSESGADSQSGL